MTSRQPGTAPRGALSSQGTLASRRTLASRGWAARVLPPALLIVLTLAGLRGAITAPRWDGPLHRQGITIGLALIAVLVALLVLTLVRHRAGQALPGSAAETDIAAKLRTVLIYVLSGGILATIVTILFALHLHLFNGKPRPARRPQAPRPPRPRPPNSGNASPWTFSLPLRDILYGLLVLALIAAVVVSIMWSGRLRRPARPGGDIREEDDSENLREAVESGRSALRTLDDARAAIIACYLAMEESLAERGATRAVADTPDELLARATRSKIVHGTAAARLTALFYEARFSSHPMDQTQRQAAEQALDELAAALAAQPAEAGADA
jgi:hypothetical protein